MSAAVDCCRCGRTATGLDRPPFAGPLGVAVETHACRECWDLWRETEVRIINELRLNFMDPEAQKTLERHLREFLELPAAGDTGV